MLRNVIGFQHVDMICTETSGLQRNDSFIKCVEADGMTNC